MINCILYFIHCTWISLGVKNNKSIQGIKSNKGVCLEYLLPLELRLNMETLQIINVLPTYISCQIYKLTLIMFLIFYYIRTFMENLLLREC